MLCPSPCHRLYPFKGDVETAERDTVAGSGRDQRLSGVCRIGRHTQNGDRDAEVRQDHAPDVQRGALQATSEQGQKACNGGEDARSEEHTSELQSLMRISYAVFCLKTKQKKDKIMLQQTREHKTQKDT